MFKNLFSILLPLIAFTLISFSPEGAEFNTHRDADLLLARNASVVNIDLFVKEPNAYKAVIIERSGNATNGFRQILIV